MKQKLKKLFEEYGRVGIVTYFVIYGLTLVGIAVAISMGFEIEGASGTAGLLAGTWVASRATLPLRIGATILLTPVVHSVYRKFRPVKPGPAADAATLPPSAGERP